MTHEMGRKKCMYVTERNRIVTQKACWCLLCKLMFQKTLTTHLWTAQPSFRVWLRFRNSRSRHASIHVLSITWLMQYIWQDNNRHLPVVGSQSPLQGTWAGGEPWRAARTGVMWVYDLKSDFKSHLNGRGRSVHQWHLWQRRGDNNGDKNGTDYWSYASHKNAFQFTSTIPEHSSDLN